MKLNSVKLGAASAIAFSVLWVICSATVAVSPDSMMTISGHMIHADLSNIGWSLSWTGFFLGLIAWAVVADVTVWLVAAVYNRI